MKKKTNQNEKNIIGREGGREGGSGEEGPC